MNTETKITGREEAIAKLDEWNQQAEAATKERADLLERLQKAVQKAEQQLSQVQSDYKILRKAEQQLKEAVWIIKNRPTMLTQGGTTQWHELCNVFLAPPPA